MAKILVTGGSGLVGSRLLKRFVAAGRDMRGLVRPGKELPAGVEAVVGDILQPDALPAAVRDVSAVVHLAASFRSRDDEDTWRVNLDGTKNLVAAVQEHAPQARLLMASTGNVYDADIARPAREDDDLHPALAYPASKVQAEQVLRDSGLTWAILRLPFVYGDGDGHLESAAPLMAQMNWHPAQRMSMGHHEDVAAAFALALTGAMDGLIVNIADDSPVSIYEMAAIAGESYPASAEPVQNPWRGVMDTTVARRLGFRPAVRTVYQAKEEGKL